ncbi:MAG: hypothetical protein GY810_32185 [Aureispira sp.]|nr:hypothetical protein [Aureispira sp.]
MPKTHKDYEKIAQFLKSKNSSDVLLGIQLLKSSMDADLLIAFLSKESYLSYILCYPLVTYFQDNSALWNAVSLKIPKHIKNGITKWLSCTILELKRPTVATFCVLANQKIKAYYSNFPKLSPQILTEDEDYGYGFIESGSAIVDGIGWTLEIEEEYQGPAETCLEETWRATAYHPDCSIRITLRKDDLFPKIWLKKLETKKD